MGEWLGMPTLTTKKQKVLYLFKFKMHGQPCEGNAAIHKLRSTEVLCLSTQIKTQLQTLWGCFGTERN
jgi:hypothetical protein